MYVFSQPSKTCTCGHNQVLCPSKINTNTLTHTISVERWDKEKKLWFTGGNVAAYKPGSFNMCLRHMGFRPTKPAR